MELGIQRIYVKDISFESPRVPNVFKQQWAPNINVELGVQRSELEPGLYEVTLQLSIDARQDGEPVFVVEVEQAGLFVVKGVEGEELNRVLMTFCPNLLFPYAREVVDSLCGKGSFPPLMLAPVNFEALYQQKKSKAN